MELNKAKGLVKETLENATRLLDIEFVEPRFLNLDDEVACYVDRYHYLVKFNRNWLEKVSEEDIIITTYRKVRHAYQQAQIEFRDKLVAGGLDVEPYNLVECWKDEFQYYNVPKIEEESSNDFLSQSCEIDAYAFAYAMCLTFNSMEIEVPEVIKEDVKMRVETILSKLM